MQIGFESSYHRDFFNSDSDFLSFRYIYKSKKSIGSNDLRNEYPFSMFMENEFGWP